MKIEIPILLGSPLNSGTEIVIGVIDALTLTKHFTIAEYDYEKKGSQKGYQREATKGRINKLACSIQNEEVDIPTSVLLCCSKETFDEKTKILSIKEETEFEVIDGQHRIKALKTLLGVSDERLSKMKIPFVCLIGADQEECSKQFVSVNGNAKSIKTDLNDTLRYENGNFTEKEDWKEEAIDMERKLNSDSEIWKGRILQPNQNKEKGKFYIASTAMRKGLKEFVCFPRIVSYEFEEKFDIIEAYWKGIKDLIPDAFEENTAENFSFLTAAVPLRVFNKLYPNVYDICMERNISIFDDKSYEEILEPVINNVEDGINFWKKGKDGKVGAYSSEAGYKKLTLELARLLPKIGSSN